MPILPFASESSILKGGGIMLRLIFILLAIPLLVATACAPVRDVAPKEAAPMADNYNTGDNGGGS